MSIVEEYAVLQSSLPIGPAPGTTFAQAVTSTVGTLDLSAYVGNFVDLQADGGQVYYLMGTPGALPAPNPAATGNGTGVCMFLAAGERRSIYLYAGGPSVIGYVTATGTATLRVQVSSVPSTAA